MVMEGENLSLSNMTEMFVENVTIGCTHVSHTQFSTPCPKEAFSAFGTILFCFGGMSVFPSIQAKL